MSAISFLQRHSSSTSRASLLPPFFPATAVHGGFGVFNDIIPMQIADLAAMNAPNDPTFVGGIGGQVGGVRELRLGLTGAPLTRPQARTSPFNGTLIGFQLCEEMQPGAPTCPLAVSLNTFPKRHAQDALLLSIQFRH